MAGISGALVNVDLPQRGEAWRAPQDGRNGRARIAALIGLATASWAANSAGCFAALTMIKKALPFRFPLMSQADRMADQLARVGVDGSVENSGGSVDIFVEKPALRLNSN
jgi:hypothetical protein